MHMGGAPGNLAAEFIGFKKKKVKGKNVIPENLLVNNDFHNFSQCNLLLKYSQLW